jgi:Flp pilus assembly protein TadG
MPANDTKPANKLRLVKWVATRWRDTSGNVAIITALLLPVLIAVAGFGMDYAYAAFVKQRLDRAAEAAVIGAVSQNAATSGGGYSNVSWLYDYGLNIFTGNVSQLSVGTVTPTLTVTQKGNGAVATLTYSANVPTLFSGIVGIKSFPVTGTASANASGITYINYYIVVDISQSMGIGSTSTDMTNLYNRSAAYNGGGCVFGCHVEDTGQTYTNEYLAHNMSPTITLRIDSAVAAIQSIVSSAKTAAGSHNNIQIGLYTMSEDPVTGKLFNTIASPSSNYSSLTSLAATIDLGNNVAGGLGDSDFVDQLTQFNAVIPASGSGVSATSPLNYVFIITDGMVDTPGAGCIDGHCTAAFLSSYCSSLKTKATVGVIYTTYLPIYTNNNPADGYHIAYAALAEPYVGQIPTNLQNCASSSSYYFEASDGPAITTAMQALFAQTISTATLTQ